MYIYNIEALAEMAFYFVKEDFGWIVVDAFLRPAYRKCDQKTLAQHIIRLCNQFRMGYALLAIEALAETTESDPRIKNWLATMEAQIRKIAKEDLAGHRRPLYAYADRYETNSDRYVETAERDIFLAKDDPMRECAWMLTPYVHGIMSLRTVMPLKRRIRQQYRICLV